MDNNKDKLEKLIGKGAISENTDDLASYSADCSLTGVMAPKYIVKANNVEEVHKIVQWANETSTPLIPVSSAAPHFHGDTVPSINGAVIVDISGMKKIIHVDGKNRVVIVEPGVTYEELQPVLAREKLRLSTPLMPRQGKSVLASVIEREPTLIPKYRWLFSDPLRCIEVIWGNGHKMMTGEAGVFTSLESAWKRNMVQLKPFGPAQVDYYKFVQAAQGTMGIVTWAALRCERLPVIHKLFFVKGNNLEELTGFAYKLLRIRFGDEFLFLNNTELAYLLGKDAEKIGSLKSKLPNWVLVLGVCGRDMLAEERIKFLESDFADMAKEFKLKLETQIAGVSSEEMLHKLLNVSEDPYWKMRLKSGCQDIFFITTLDKTYKFIEIMHSLSKEIGYPSADIGIYLQPVHQGSSCHCEFTVPYDKNNAAETKTIQKFLDEGCRRLIEEGAFFSRPYEAWANMVYSRDEQSVKALKIVKNIFDPNNIMNPGKLCFK